MASRFNKPDPSIKKNVLRARAASRKAKNTHASVVVTSLLATLFAWAMFSEQDAQAIRAAQAARANPAALTIAAPKQSDTSLEVTSTQVPTRQNRQLFSSGIR
ncbi:MAG TPA: hypothetical protein VJ183_13995 [Chloroflexia bacterium]|nr:hypothetical protein [Chloroflexia bacterium]